MAAGTETNVIPIKPAGKIKSGKEYVSGSPYFSNMPRVLPSLSERFLDNSITVTPEVAAAMLRDPDVFSSLLLLALMAMNEDLLISPALQASAQDQEEDQPPTPSILPEDAIPQDTKKPAAVPEPTQKQKAEDQTPEGDETPDNMATDPRVELAKDIADFCQRQVTRVPKFASIMFQMVFEGMVHGNKVAENIIETAVRGTDAGRWCLQNIKPKPYQAIAFVVDPYMNELGMIGAQPGQAMVTYTTLIPDIQDIIPREKFSVFTYRPKNGDPRGQTALEAAVNGWHLKNRTWPEYLLFLMVCAIPGIIATMSNDADQVTLFEDDGVTPKIDPETGEPMTLPANQYMLNVLGQMRNHQVAVVPEGTEVTLLEAASEGAVFTEAFTIFSKEIVKALQLNELATRDSKHQTKGATGEQMHVIDYIVWWLRDTAADMIKFDILKPLVKYNFGDDAADELLPICSYGDTEARNWAVDGTAAAQLAPVLTESQLQHVLQQLGIPAPTETEQAFKRMSKLLGMQGQQKAVQGDPNSPNDPKNKDNNSQSDNKDTGKGE